MGDSNSQFAEWREEFSPDRKPVDICFNRELLAELEEANQELRALQAGEGKMLEAKKELLEAEARVHDLIEKVKATEKTLVFQSIGTKAWRDLLSEHPPVGEQVRQIVMFTGAPLEYNPDTFIPMALHKCCIEPGMSLEDAQWFCEVFPLKEIDRAFGAVTTCNVTGLDRPFDDTGSLLRGVKR